MTIAFILYVLSLTGVANLKRKSYLSDCKNRKSYFYERKTKANSEIKKRKDFTAHLTFAILGVWIAQLTLITVNNAKDIDLQEQRINQLQFLLRQYEK